MLLLLLSQAIGDWPLGGGSNQRLGVQLLKGAMEDAPVLKWVAEEVRDYPWGQPKVADVDGDGTPEVLVVEPQTLFCLSGADGSVKWSVDTVYDAYNVSGVADLDGDGVKELVLGSWDYYFLASYSGSDGTEEWVYELQGELGVSEVGIADVNGDGALDVLANDYGGYSHCVSGSDGSQIWQEELSVYTDYSGVALGDLDGDGDLDAVFLGDYNGLSAVDAATGQVLWEVDPGFSSYSNPVLADVNGDGAPEVLVAFYDTSLICFGHDGSVLWEYEAAHSLASPVVADFDGDSALEVIVSGVNAVLTCLTGSGEVEWVDTIGTFAYYFALAAADINGDDTLDVLVGAPDSLIALSGASGRHLWTYTDITNHYMLSVADADGDGCSEIIVSMENDSPYVRVLDDASGATDCGQFGLSEGSGSFGAGLRLQQRGGELWVSVPSPRFLEVKLYDPAGRLEQVLFRGKARAGSYKFSVPKGVHIVKAGEAAAVVVR